jgi:hypothetical protein
MISEVEEVRNDKGVGGKKRIMHRSGQKEIIYHSVGFAVASGEWRLKCPSCRKARTFLTNGNIMRQNRFPNGTKLRHETATSGKKLQLLRALK